VRNLTFAVGLTGVLLGALIAQDADGDFKVTLLGTASPPPPRPANRDAAATAAMPPGT
jgi:hypothetical protein